MAQQGFIFGNRVDDYEFPTIISIHFISLGAFYPDEAKNSR